MDWKKPMLPPSSTTFTVSTTAPAAHVPNTSCAPRRAALSVRWGGKPYCTAARSTHLSRTLHAHTTRSPRATGWPGGCFCALSGPPHMLPKQNPSRAAPARRRPSDRLRTEGRG